MPDAEGPPEDHPSEEREQPHEEQNDRRNNEANHDNSGLIKLEDDPENYQIENRIVPEPQKE